MPLMMPGVYCSGVDLYGLPSNDMIETEFMGYPLKLDLINKKAILTICDKNVIHEIHEITNSHVSFEPFRI